MGASNRRLQIAAVLFLLIISVALGLLNGCGDGNGSSGNTPRGSGSSMVLVAIGDATSDTIAVFSTTVKSVSLTDTSGNIVPVLSSPVALEITHLTGTTQPVATATIAQNTYSKVTITLDVSTATVVDPTTNKESQQPLPAPASPVTVTLSPSLVLGSSPLVLNLDLSLARSITLNSSGNLVFNPVFMATNGTIGATPSSPFNGGAENEFGSVTGVTNTSFTVAVSSQSLSFITNSSTQFVSFNTTPPQIAIGMLLMVDGKAQSDGSLLATRVEAINPQGTAQSTLGALGLIRAVDRTISRLQLLVRGAAGPLTSTVGSGLLADFNSNTPYRVDNDGVDVSNLAFATKFNASTIAPGQFVEVDTSTPASSVTPPPNTLASLEITTTQVRLEQQPLIGTVSNFFNGVSFFTLNLAADSVFAKSTGTTSVTVFIQPGTSLLTSPSNGSTVLVRGLLFLDGSVYKMVAGRILPAP